MHYGEPVIAADLRSDPRWTQFRHLAHRHRLGACWSSPIRTRTNVVGTFAVYADEPYRPDRRDQELVRRFTHLTSLAVEQDRGAKEREARRTAEVARRSAEAANHAKSQFVTALSHEIRTPLQSITGFTEHLQTLDLTPEQRVTALRHIEAAAAHILALVDDVLDLARVEADSLPIDRQPVALDTVVNSSLELLRPSLDQAQITIDRRGPDAVIHADPRRLRQVLLNLLANAVRFSPRKGQIGILTERSARQIRIIIIDHGPGIAEDLLPRLFIPFDRLGTDARHPRGAGIGLVLARRLTEAMHGTLTLTSTLGEGTRITVTMPTAEPAPSTVHH